MGNFCKGVSDNEQVDNSKKQLLDSMPLNKPSLKEFQKQKKLGQGSYGSVYLVIYKDQYFAMKEIKKSRIKKESTRRHILEEREILSKVKSDYLVELKYAFQDDSKLYLIVSLVAGGELYFHLRKKQTFSLDIARFFAAEILMALQELHKNKIIYRDLKPENILLDEYGHIKLTDFGLSKFLVNDKAHSMCGTPEYLAPEVIFSKDGYTYKADFYSFGCILYEMLFGMPPFFTQDKKKMFQDRVKKKIKLPSCCDNDAKQLIEGLLQIDPQQRLGLQEIKNHEFFKSIDFDSLRQMTSPYEFESNGFDYFQIFHKTQNSTTHIMQQIQEYPDFHYDQNQQQN